MMRVILLNLPWRKDNRWGVRAGSRWPFTSPPEENGYIKYIPFPFFLAQATTLLRTRGNEAELIDAIAQGMDEDTMMREIMAYNPQLAVIETSTPSFYNDIRIASEIKKKIPGIYIALCGPHASTYAGPILKEQEFIDYVLEGEYEYTLLELADRLSRGGSLNGVPGLVFKEGRSVIANRARPAIKDLDSLPWPERDKRSIYKYNDGFAGLPVPNVQIYSSRGCPFRCIFCLWPQVLYGGHKYRKRNPAKVIDEMEWLIGEFGFKAVYFDDDVFNIDKSHVMDICGEITGRGIKIPWAAMARADLMSEKLLSVMSNAGLYAIKYGIESVDKKVLKLCRKELGLARAKKMIAHTRRLGIKLHLTFCLGLPGETKKSVRDTIDFIAETNPDSFQISFATPFPGTHYYRYLEKRGVGLSKNLEDYDGSNSYIGDFKGIGGLDLEKIKNDFCSSLDFK
jgi:radical SAM superfamily enzyme YgiQ (UPF0313 family)